MKFTKPRTLKLLSNYLLLPARLPSIISLQEFTSLFPKSQQSSAQIRSLYRDLQQQRNLIVDDVAEKIEAEVRTSRTLRRELLRARVEAEYEERDDEIDRYDDSRDDQLDICLLYKPELADCHPVIPAYDRTRDMASCLKRVGGGHIDSGNPQFTQLHNLSRPCRGVAWSCRPLSECTSSWLTRV